MSTPIASSTTPAKAAGDSGSAQARSGQVGVSDFSQLLQAAGQPIDAQASEWLDAAATVGGAMPSLNAESVVQELLPVDLEGWSVQSLVGQTAQLDQAVEAALQDGSVVQDRLNKGWPTSASSPLGRGPAQVSGQLPVVAQGVQGAGNLSVQEGGLLTPSATMPATAAMGMAAAADAVAQEAQQMLDAATRDMEPRAEEVRVPLQGQWVAADRNTLSAEQMQRVMGQVAQWMAAQVGGEGGAPRRATSRGASAGDAGSAEGLSGAWAGSATRLTDNAVSAAAASASASDATASHEMADTQDMRWWMGTQQQRAEMVLDRDGQPVRVQVQVQGNEAQVIFRSDEQATREMLDASVAQLRDLLAQQGLALAQVQVEQQSTGGHEGGAQADGRDDFMPAGATAARIAVPEAGSETVARGARTASGLDVFA